MEDITKEVDVVETSSRKDSSGSSAPVPLPRTVFSDDLESKAGSDGPENITKIQGKSSKSTYDKIKQLLPVPKPRASKNLNKKGQHLSDLLHSRLQNKKGFSGKKQTHHQMQETNRSTSPMESSEDDEDVGENLQFNDRESSQKTETSVVRPRTHKTIFQDPVSNNAEQADLRSNTGREDGNSKPTTHRYSGGGRNHNRHSRPPHTRPPPPPHNRPPPPPHSRPPPPPPSGVQQTKIFTIRNFHQLEEVSQKAISLNVTARKEMTNSQYLKAAKKYERCLNCVDDVLETSLRKLRLTNNEEAKASEIMRQMKMLRKEALEGFSDSQCCSSEKPSTTASLPPDSPPSYNDVLTADLMSINTDDQSGDLLRPTVAPVPIIETLINFDDSVAAENPPERATNAQATPHSPPAVHNCTSSNGQQDDTTASKVTDTASEARRIIPNNSNSTAHQNDQLSVRPKSKPTPRKENRNSNTHDFSVIPKTPNTGMSEDSKNGGEANSNSQSKFLYPDLNESTASSDSDMSFVTAVSSPVSLKTPNTRHNDNEIKLLSNNAIEDPFVLENPFKYDYRHSEETDKSIFDFTDMSNSSFQKDTLPSEISFMPERSFHTEVIGKSTNPFTCNLMNGETEGQKEIISDECIYSKSSIDSETIDDPFHTLSLEFRKKYNLNVKDTDTPPQVKIEKPKNLNEMRNSNNATDNFPVSPKPVEPLEFNSMLTPSKKSKHYQSDANISEIYTTPAARSASRRNKKLVRTKRVSRSNESVLLMFDPCIHEKDEEKEANKSEISENNLDKSINHCDDALDNPLYGMIEEYSLNNPLYGMIEDYSQKDTAKNIEFPQDVIVSGATKLINLDESNENNEDIIKTVNHEHSVSKLPEATDSEVKKCETVNADTTDSTRQSMYPELPMEDLADRPLPAIPSKKLNQRSTNNASVNDNSDTQSTKSTTSTKKGKGKSPKLGNNDGDGSREIGHSSFYISEETGKPGKTASQNNENEGKVGAAKGQQKDMSDVTCPRPPPRSTSKKSINSIGNSSSSWIEIMHVADAVKLFFLGDSDVSSPFNRQSLTILRRDWSSSIGKQQQARVEVGGELFVLELQNKTTRVMQDHHGDYIVRSPTGVFMCLVLSSAMKKSHITTLDKTFQIYAQFIKEPQGVRLPSEVESAAANVKKTVQEKAPTVAKATNALRNNSMRALRRLKGAIGVDSQSDRKQDLAPEFVPLKEACVMFRAARLTKAVRFF